MTKEINPITGLYTIPTKITGICMECNDKIVLYQLGPEPFFVDSRCRDSRCRGKYSFNVEVIKQ